MASHWRMIVDATKFNREELVRKNEENSSLKNLNERLLVQIEEEIEKKDMNKVDTSDNEENPHLKNHNINLLMQIKKLKNDKKSLESKVEQLIKETSKSSNVKIQVEKKGTNTDPINITT
jgi:hypothetical protein